jgi:predicted metal-dependent phosphoesterase TrpH
VVDSLYAHPFIKGVAVTDHDSLMGYFQIRKLAQTYEGLVIIPGVEVTTKLGHLILLGVEEKPAYEAPLEIVIDFAKERQGIIVIPHPYRVGGIGEAAKEIPADAVETLNSHTGLRENKMAEMLAKIKNLPGVAGSDAHNHDELWTVYTEIEAEPEVENVLRAIKQGQVKVASSGHV